MGAVYESSDAAGRQVAIKIPYSELIADDYAQRRFNDEGIAGSIVKHRNIARVLEHGETPTGIPYLLMEYVDGQRLTTEDGLPSLRRAASIVHQLLDGLDALHSSDIVHADVKADNVLVGPYAVKLIDFGLAHICGHVPANQLVSGTPDYMAPEVIRGEGSTPSSDLYAAGVILYELLTGQTPFGGGDSSEIVQRHLSERVVPPSLRRVDVEIPSTLERIVLRSLDKDPRERIESAAAFAEALEVTLPGLDDRVPIRRHKTARGIETVPRVGRLDSVL
jgi:serine/threonine-protein kinase